MHGISVAAGDLCAGGRGVDAEHDHHAAYGSVLGNGDCAGGRAGILVLEAEREESCNSTVEDR